MSGFTYENRCFGVHERARCYTLETDSGSLCLGSNPSEAAT
jgi:hypothetical protein